MKQGLLLLHLLGLVFSLQAQHDFDYQFSTDDWYFKIEAGDTTQLAKSSLIAKFGDTLSIQKTKDEKLKLSLQFEGSMLGGDLLVYSTKTGKRIYCNPMWGYLLIIHSEAEIEVFGKGIVNYQFIRSIDQFNH